MKVPSNLRNATYSTSSGKHVSKTGQLKNGAKLTAAEQVTNKTKEYRTGSTNMGPLGAKNSAS
jgi:hypothetical protein